MPAPYVAENVGAAAPVHPDVVVRRSYLQSFPDSTFEIAVRACFGCAHFGMFLAAFVLTVLTYIRVDELHTELMPK
jgi:hypothetical protein